MRRFLTHRGLYKVSGELNTEQELELLQKLPEFLQEGILYFLMNMEFIEITEKVTLVMMNDHELKKIKQFMHISDINYEIVDMTDYVIKGEEFLDGEFDKEKYQEFINKFLELNLTKDIILDKISMLGMNCLKEVDLKILSE